MRRAAFLILACLSLVMVADLVVRTVVPAFEPAKTDFSELYTSAWLWRHGQNYYNSHLATVTHARLVGVSVQLAPIYPPSTFVLLSPLTLMPYQYANFIWLLLSFSGVCGSTFLVWRLSGLAVGDVRTAALIAFLLSFAPMHQAFHLGNVVLVVFPLVLWAILLASSARYWIAGALLGVATCLKPQIGIWILFYYGFRSRWQMLLGAFASGALVGAVLLLRPPPILNVIADYRANLHFWFDPGRPYGFTEGSLPFHVNVIQVLFYRAFHNIQAANIAAHALTIVGVLMWMLLMRRTDSRISGPLAITTILSLSFISLYHSVSDATVLTLAAAWILEGQPWTRTKTLACSIFSVLMLPGHSALMRLTPELSSSVTSAWWWTLLINRYFVWSLVALDVVLLVALAEESRRSATENRIARTGCEGAKAGAH
jgi:hypothetical protein